MDFAFIKSAFRILFLRILILVILAVCVGILTGNNDAARHSTIVLFPLLIGNLLLLLVLFRKVKIDFLTDGTITKSHVLFKDIGINENLFARLKFYRYILTVYISHYTVAKHLMTNLKII